MGDVSVDVFTIPMVEFDCLGGPKLKSRTREEAGLVVQAVPEVGD